MSTQLPRYWNPYAAGLALGIVLLGTFVLVGRGLGASGAFMRMVSLGVETVAPARVMANPVYRDAGDEAGGPMVNWLLLEVAGMAVGGAISAAAAGRWHAVVERGPTTRRPGRVLMAFAGGTVMAFGARLARGCTSGQALSGGAVLAAGSWVFMLALFAGAYGAVALSRKQWR